MKNKFKKVRRDDKITEEVIMKRVKFSNRKKNVTTATTSDTGETSEASHRASSNLTRANRVTFYVSIPRLLANGSFHDTSNGFGTVSE